MDRHRSGSARIASAATRRAFPCRACCGGISGAAGNASCAIVLDRCTTMRQIADKRISGSGAGANGCPCRQPREEARGGPPPRPASGQVRVHQERAAPCCRSRARRNLRCTYAPPTGIRHEPDGPPRGRTPPAKRGQRRQGWSIASPHRGSTFHATTTPRTTCRAQPRGRARRQDRLHRRCRQLHATASCRAGRTAPPMRLRGWASRMEDRIMLVRMLDTIDFPAVFLGAIKAGIVPVAVNTLLTTGDYEFMLRDSRARRRWSSPSRCCRRSRRCSASCRSSKHVIVAGRTTQGHLALRDADGRGRTRRRGRRHHARRRLLLALLLGSTGTPKGTVHLHSSLIQTAELYARGRARHARRRRRVLGGQAVLRLRPGQLR